MGAALDVLVVGGGPAGLATAIRARQRGLRVAVIDHAAPPIDKACGEGLMPGGTRLLERLGVELSPSRCRPFHGIRYVDGDLVVEGRFAALAGRGVRRVHLHQALVARAETLGVELRWNEAALGLAHAGVRTGRTLSRARWIVAADGLRSPLRRWAGLEGRPAPRRRFGLRRHYEIEPWSQLVEVHWGAGAEAYVTPVGPRCVGVALLWSGERRSFDAMLALWPALERRLRGAPGTSRERGAGPLEQRVRAVVSGNLALVGDAAGYVDAVAGEGLSLGFAQAFAVIEAIERGDLGRYAAAHRRIVAGPNARARLLLLLGRRPLLRRWILRAAGARPGGAEGLPRVAAGGAGWTAHLERS
jgi:flavin-dependent dehydrogenase